MTIAFLGTGIMGEAMCRHLLVAGETVRVWNRHREKTARLVELGGTICDTPAHAVEGADIVIVMLSTGQVVDRILFEPNQAGNSVETSLAPGSVVIVMSSIPIETARNQASRLAARGIEYLDAPVSGGDQGAVAGRLSIMVGGNEDVVSRVNGCLEKMGTATRVGPVGCGQLAKLANQIIVGLAIEAVAEALLLIRAGGGDFEAVQNALAGGFADSTVLRQHGTRMISDSFEPGAKAGVQLKDLRTALEYAEKHGLKLPGLRLVTGLYAQMCEQGRESLDHSALLLQIADQQPDSSQPFG